MVLLLQNFLDLCNVLLIDRQLANPSDLFVKKFSITFHRFSIATFVTMLFLQFHTKESLPQHTISIVILMVEIQVISKHFLLRLKQRQQKVIKQTATIYHYRNKYTHVALILRQVPMSKISIQYQHCRCILHVPVNNRAVMLQTT